MLVNGLELFAGGGGLLLGAAKAGINHVAAVEWDKWACDTLRSNARSHQRQIDGLTVIQGDVRTVDFADPAFGRVDLITGGPPCQPFSLGGKARAADDPRDMFPALTEAIAVLRPSAFVVENVKGLTRSAFQDYFEYIKIRLEYPLMRAKPAESWIDHFQRIRQTRSKSVPELRYNLSVNVVNAADYGVPQHRHRVFIVGFRSDINTVWKFPDPTHSGAALLNSQVDGSYWDKFEVPARHRINLRRAPGNPYLLPWNTVRHAINDLPAPRLTGSRMWMDHVLQPGAKSYVGHTGSPIDEPSKALKAGGHGVPGGENMIRFPDGKVRYFSIREAARIQTFPDDYSLHGSWGEVMRQLGNAVPVKLAEIVIESVKQELKNPGSESHQEKFEMVRT